MRRSSTVRSIENLVGLRAVWVAVGLAAVALAVGASATSAWSTIGSSTSGARGSARRPLTLVTACDVFTLAEARTLIDDDATADPHDSRAVDFDGQRNTQCAYASVASGLAVLQVLIPLTRKQGDALRTAFARDKVAFRGTTVHGIGSAAFWKTKVGAPALYVRTTSGVVFNLGATTNGG